MIGAIAGDIIGSVHEFRHPPTKTKVFALFEPRCTFTDDSVMTIAVAQAILEGRDYGVVMHELGNRYPGRGYGGGFARWLASPHPRPYGSYGNGAAMRVSPVGWAWNTREEVLREAARSAEPTHNHPEGIKGAQATALAIWLCRNGSNKEELRAEIERTFGYNLQRTVDGIRPGYRFNETCQETVPEAIVAFLDSTSWEDAVRNAISLGGDADTLACITGSIAEAFYGPVPEAVAETVRTMLTAELWGVVERFCEKYVKR